MTILKNDSTHDEPVKLNARHLFFTKPLHDGIVGQKVFFTRRVERLNCLVDDLFMTLPTIQVFPIHVSTLKSRVNRIA